MTQPTYENAYSANAAENYERYFVPAIGRPVVEVRSAPQPLRLPAPEDFLWQSVYSTPMAAAFTQVDENRRAALTQDFAERCAPFVEEGFLAGEVTALAKG